MNKYNLNEDLFSNIDITEDLKKEIYRNCKRGKRTGDLRFRYAGILSALIVAVVVGGTGISASALYGGVKARMENMSEEEHADYVYEIDNNTEVTMTGNWSRSLSNDEVLRMADLEKQYNDQDLFPSEEVKRVATLAEWDGQSVCFVDEDNRLHVPEGAMNDEQLLQLIDYSAKTDYVIEENAKEYYAETGFEKPYVDVDAATEEDIVNLAYSHLKYFLGEDISEGWETTLEAFKPSLTDPENADMDMYTVYWRQPGATPGVNQYYVVVLGMHDLHFIAAGVDGNEYEAKLKSYTYDEAMKIAETAKPKIYKILAEKYGYTTIDRERHEAWENFTYDDNDVRQLRYVFQSGDEIFEIMWDIADERLALIEIWPEGEDFEPWEE